MSKDMRNLLIPTLMLALLAPLAVAQEKNETRPDDAAWVDDCPPDMMCAAGAEDEPTRGPEDGSCENCRGEDQPIPYGPEGCIECSGMPPEEAPGTCMDGSDEGEACDDDVQYLDGGAPPADVQAGSNAENAVPGAGLALVAAAFAAAVFIAIRRA